MAMDKKKKSKQKYKDRSVSKNMAKVKQVENILGGGNRGSRVPSLEQQVLDSQSSLLEY